MGGADITDENGEPTGPESAPRRPPNSLWSLCLENRVIYCTGVPTSHKNNIFCSLWHCIPEYSLLLTLLAHMKEALHLYGMYTRC
jgi:hypothetical protein